MKTLALLLFAMACSSNGLSQISSIKASAPFSVSEGGIVKWREVITNQSGSSITAIAANFICPNSRLQIDTDFDVLLYFGSGSPIPSGGSYEINAGDPSSCSGGVNAVIFSDGHEEGDSKDLNRIRSARQGAAQALHEIIPMLTSVYQHNESTAQVVSTLADNLKASRALMSHTGRGYAFICQVVMNSLNRGIVIHVPSDDTPQKLPSVKAKMATEGLSQEDALATLLGEKLQQWQDALKPNHS